MPIRGARTPYTLFFGDVLGWLSIAGLIAAAGVVVLRRRRDRIAKPALPADHDPVPNRPFAGVGTPTAI